MPQDIIKEIDREKKKLIGDLDFKDITKNIAPIKIEKVVSKTPVVNPTIANAVIRLNDIKQNFQLNNSIANANKAFANMGKVLYSIALNIPPIVKSLNDALNPLRYYWVLDDLKWPLFLIDDKKFIDAIITANSESKAKEEIDKIIFDYCNDNFIDNLENDWLALDTICEERKPILSEAILMHKKGYYYASTTILACQIYGISSDFNDVLKSKGIELDEEDKKSVIEYFEIDPKTIDNEKGKLLQKFLFIENGVMAWDCIFKYLQKEILSSHDSKIRLKTQPMRNKICHGAQFGYNTKEHSLKAILVVDILIQLSYILSKVEIQDENDK